VRVREEERGGKEDGDLEALLDLKVLVALNNCAEEFNFRGRFGPLSSWVGISVRRRCAASEEQ
jgi:hypothetical protein